MKGRQPRSVSRNDSSLGPKLVGVKRKSCSERPERCTSRAKRAACDAHSERKLWSSQAGSALAFWLLLGQAKSNNTRCHDNGSAKAKRLSQKDNNSWLKVSPLTAIIPNKIAIFVSSVNGAAAQRPSAVGRPPSPPYSVATRPFGREQPARCILRTPRRGENPTPVGDGRHRMSARRGHLSSAKEKNRSNHGDEAHGQTC